MGVTVFTDSLIMCVSSMRPSIYESLLCYMYPQALIRLAVKPGSGWAVSVQDMLEVLTPGTFGLMGEGGESSPRLSWPTFFNTALHILNR